jgi:cytochrome c oxidase subunit 1
MTTLTHAPTASRPVPNPQKSLITKLHMGTGVVVGIIFCWGTYFAMRAGRDMTDSHNVNKVLLMSMFAWSVGFLIGIGAFIGPFRWLIGKDLTDEEQLYLAGDGQGISRYFRYCTDHKVVGIQYLVGVMTLLGAGGTMAMMIRTNLATKCLQLFSWTPWNNDDHCNDHCRYRSFW